MTDVNIYANKLKFKLKNAYVKLNNHKEISNLNSFSSTKLIITPLAKNIILSKNLNNLKVNDRLPLKQKSLNSLNHNSLNKSSNKSLNGNLSPLHSFITKNKINKKFNHSVNINLGKISKPKNLKLFSIKKNSQFYNDNINPINLPINPSSNQPSFNSFNRSLNTSFNAFNKVDGNSFNNNNIDHASQTGTNIDIENPHKPKEKEKEELPSINKILKTPLKLSKSPIKDFTPNSLNVAKSLLQLGSGYY